MMELRSILILIWLPAGALAQLLPDEQAAALINSLPARSIGPANMSGRITDLDVVESDPKTIYLAAATGGVWKTVDAGKTWSPLFDEQGTLCIGDVTIAPSNPDIIWAGTGEANPRNSVSWGDGVYKSIDAGKTWKHMGLRETRHIGRIAVHPKNPDIVYVAAMGRFWGPNKERGLYKTTDGGKTWDLCKFLDDETGFVDVTLDPEEPEIVYAAAWRLRRSAFSIGNPAVQTGPKAGLYRSDDGGKSWEKLEKGLPDRPMGRCGLAVYRKDPKIVYAVIQTDLSPITTIGALPKTGEDVTLGGIFRSGDKGQTWKKLNDLCPRPFYYGQIRIDPTDDQRIYVLGVAFYLSTDGGKTFANPMTGMHADHHAMWINPSDPKHLVVGNDGGAYQSHDQGKTWNAFRMPLGQFYGICVDQRHPYRIYGGLQDNGTWGGPSASRVLPYISALSWRKWGPNDGFQCFIDPADNYTLFGEDQYGGLIRVGMGINGMVKAIKPRPTNKTAYRFNWETPMMASAHDPKTIYCAGNHVFKSTTRGDKWATISPDLTHGKPGPSADGGHTITAIAESPKKAGVLYAGTDDGRLHVSKDDGITWADLSVLLPGIPVDYWVNRIHCSSFDAATAFMAIDRHRQEDIKPHLFKTVDFGATWKPLASDLPEGAVVRVIRESTRKRDLLFAGTEQGLFVSLDGGRRWHRYTNGFPPFVAVYDLVIHPRERELVIGTHGRSIYIVDIAPLEELTPQALEAPAHLFPIKTTIVYQLKQPIEPPIGFSGANPPFGAVIYFHRKEAIAASVVITDKLDKEIRKLEVKAEAGLRSVVWDLRTTNDVLVKPGEYTITLYVGEQTWTEKLKVTDPPKGD